MHDPTEMGADNVYKLLVGAVQPRPIAWVSTVDEQGVRNLAPFSFFTVASRQPPMLFLSIGRSGRAGQLSKDTVANIAATGEFVVNIVSEDLLVPMVRSSAEAAPNFDEFLLAGVTAVASDTVRPPRVAEAPISMECRLSSLQELGTDTAVIGSVERFHVAPGVMDDRYRVQADRLRPVGRMAGPNYCLGLEPVASPPIPGFAELAEMMAEGVL